MWKRKDRKDKTLENSQKIEDTSNEQLMLNIYNPITCRVRDLDIVDYFLIQIYDSQILDIIKKKGFSIEYFDEDFYICKKVRRE